MLKQLILKAINNIMVIDKKVGRIYKFFILQTNFFSLKFVGILFVGTAFVRTPFAVSVISLHIVTESSTMLPAHLSFSQLHVVGFQI